MVLYLLELAGSTLEIPSMVIPMKDGEMGSISFDLQGNNARASQIAAGTFQDKDGVLVDFELTVDKEGNLFELDFWKVDFSKLITFPNLQDLRITTQ